MPEKTVRGMDPLGVIAIADVIRYLGHSQDDPPKPIGCPGNCGCNPQCGCEEKGAPCKCENKCACELKPGLEDILSTISNPIFREVVRELDVSRVKSINDFLAVAGEIRKKIVSGDSSTRSGRTI